MPGSKRTDDRRLDETDFGSEPSLGTSSSLLQRAKQSDPVAWNRIVNCYSGMVFQWCRTAGLRPEEARDIGQEVFLAAYRYLPEFKPRYHSGSFRGWLRAITKSKFLDFVNYSPAGMRARGGSEIRDRMEQLEFPEDNEEVLQDDLMILHRRVEQFIRAEFSDIHCEAFFRVAVHEQLPTEVASQLQISRNAVYLACTRIRRRVREEFGELLGPTSFC
jgi:RNA polymerase sigma-70 factor (ECF subfamily)